jgi:hypothetical protein
MESFEHKLSTLINEEKAIEELSYEVEKALHYYQEHPQYPLDFDKIRKRLKEVSLRLAMLGGEMQKLQHSEERL